MPDVVSQWTRNTAEIIGSSTSRRSTSATAGFSAVAVVEDEVRPVEPLQHFHGPLAIGAVADHEQLLAADRGEAAKRRLDGEGSRPLHQHAGIGFVAARELQQAAAGLGHDEFEFLSQEPQSASIANFTAREVVSGPGVSR